MLQEYIKLNYLEEENLCREIFHQLHYVGFMSKGYSVGYSTPSVWSDHTFKANVFLGKILRQGLSSAFSV